MNKLKYLDDCKKEATEKEFDEILKNSHNKTLKGSTICLQTENTHIMARETLVAKEIKAKR